MPPDPAVSPDARSRGRRWGERAVVLLLFAAVPALMVGYVAYRQAVDRREDPPPEQAPRVVSPVESPREPPPKWVPRDPPPLDVAADPPSSDGGLIAYVRPDDSGVRVVTFDGRFVAGLDGFGGEYSVSTVRLSRDRTRLAVIVHDAGKLAEAEARGDEPLGVANAGAFGEVLVYDLTKPGPPAVRLPSDHRLRNMVWGGDTTTLYVERVVWTQPTWAQTSELVRYDLAGGKETTVGLPELHRLADVSADGKSLLVYLDPRRRDGKWQTAAFLADATTLELRRLPPAATLVRRLSPDGTKALGLRLLDPRDLTQVALVVIELASGRETTVTLADDTLDWPHAIWSPDGKRLAVFRRVQLAGVEPPRGTIRTDASQPDPTSRNELLVRDPDGSNPTPLPTPDGVFWFDWR